MKTKYFLLLVSAIILKFEVFAQTEFVPGFYMINNGAKYAQIATYNDNVLEPYVVDRVVGYEEYNAHYSEDESITMPGYGIVTTIEGDYLYTSKEPEKVFNVNLSEGQVVIAFMTNNSRIYCFDLDGNPIVFSSISDLTKVPSNGSIGVYSYETNEELLEGPTISNGYYWILSQNTTNGTVKIQLPNTTVDIKAEKIIFWKKYVARFYNNVFETNGSENPEIDITIVK